LNQSKIEISEASSSSGKNDILSKILLKVQWALNNGIANQVMLKNEVCWTSLHLFADVNIRAIWQLVSHWRQITIWNGTTLLLDVSN
jgi:hypothetical protein